MKESITVHELLKEKGEILGKLEQINYLVKAVQAMATSKQPRGEGTLLEMIEELSNTEEYYIG